MTWPSLHILGSPGLGGAERFFIRLVNGLAERQTGIGVAVRPQSPVPRFLHSGVSVHPVPMRNGWDVISVFKLRALIRRIRYPVVQTYMGRATRLTRVPRDSGAVHIARLGGYYKIRGYYTHAHAWIGNTKGVCDYLIRSGLPASRVFHIPNFVPTPPPVPEETLKALRAAWRIPEEAWVIFSLGRFVPKKGFMDLLAAFSRLRPSGAQRPVILVIAGDGPHRDDLHGRCEALGLGPHVRWVGWQDEPGPFYALSHAFVCPSRHEPLGNVILEAWSHGVPVVATETVGAAELITPGVNGILTPVSDPSALARAIQEVLDDSTTRRELGENGRKTVMEFYSEARVIDQYMDLYENLVASCPR